MKTLWIYTFAATASIALTSDTAFAAYCGAVSYKGCSDCDSPVIESVVASEEAVPVAGGTYTCMKTVREIVYDRVEEVRYRNRREFYYEDQEIQRTRMVPETITKDVQYTVMVPKYETKTQTTEYTVMKPVYE